MRSVIPSKSGKECEREMQTFLSKLKYLKKKSQLISEQAKDTNTMPVLVGNIEKVEVDLEALDSATVLACSAEVEFE